MATFINDEDKEKILSASEKKLQETIGSFSNLRRSGASYTTSCPKCASESGLIITPGKGVFKCFACSEVKGKRPLDYLMTGQNMTFVEGLCWLAEHFGVILTNTQVVRPSRKASETSFCSQMLKDSGLTTDDVTAITHQGDDTHTIFKQPTFTSGTVTDTGQIDTKGDDVIIRYYDLEGFPITYIPKTDARKRVSEIPREYFRVRWQYPDEHKDKTGRPAKYRSPFGAPSLIYIPQMIRAAYKNNLSIERLYIQEGEKKAEKACKHGIPSIAIAGIQNLGSGGKLPEEIAQIVERCKVREIVFLLDSDCFDLTIHLKTNDPIEKRPRNFFYAVKNYRSYMDTLKNRGYYLEIFFGYVLTNQANDKGIDDLLTNTLKGKEDTLKQDIDQARNLKDGKGTYIQLHKITTMSENKLIEIWNLQSPERFCEQYKSQLQQLPEFIFGKHKWRYDEDGKLESAQPVESAEQFWIEKRETNKNGTEVVTYDLKYERSLVFLYNRGFGKYKRDDMNIFVRLQDKVVKSISIEDIRDYMIEFARTFLKEDILEMIHRGGAQYFGDYKLSRLKFLDLVWETPIRGEDRLYFENGFWEITADGITPKTYNSLHHFIWQDQKHKFDPTISPDLFSIERIESSSSDGSPRVDYNISLTEIGNRCHFLRFLENASNYTWRKEKMIEDKVDGVKVLPAELLDNKNHLVSKLCAIGFLSVAYKDPSISKAVIAVDGKQSEVGSSNGRSGKSLMGSLLKHIKSTVTLDGKRMDDRDNFIWTNIQEKTRLVFIDDVRKSFDFEGMFPQITGEWTVNYKGGGRAIFPFETSPKIFITTNHAIAGDSSSFMDRQWSIAFSDYYNAGHKPVDDFGMNFFTEWDAEQWNLTWNLVAQCIKLYQKLGVVEAPGERVEQRRLRQNIGEEFILWADEFFSDNSNRNVSLVRRTLFEKLLECVGSTRAKYYTAPLFKAKLRDYCKWKGYLFNPHKYDSNGRALYYDKDGRPKDEDKRGGVEYFMIGDLDYYEFAGSTSTEENIFSDPISSDNTLD